MIGSIYKITNIINNKLYIGKTYLLIEQRFKRHIIDSNKESESCRPLYKAIRKYGKDNFIVESLGQYEEGLLEEKEIEFISKFDSYHNGYNATLGGDGSRYLEISDKEIMDKYQELKHATKVAEFFNICTDTVRNVLKNNNIKLDNYHVGKFQEQTIFMIDKDNNIAESFDTTIEAGRWLIENNYTSCKNLNCVRTGISKVLSGSKKSYLGYNWTK